jgi:ethanolaminephosphotransferase
MIQTLGVKEQGLIPEVLYNMAWNEWYMVYGGIVLVFNTVSRYEQSDKNRRAN